MTPAPVQASPTPPGDIDWHNDEQGAYDPPSNERREHSKSTTVARLPTFLKKPVDYVVSLIRNPLFWGGVTFFGAVGIAGLVFFNAVLMPAYTRQEVSISVPNVQLMPFEQASRIIEANDLRPERIVQRFNPSVPRDVVVDQNPPPEAQVKPGRHIYLSVNSGSVPTVTVPRVEGLALREAKNRMINAGLKVTSERPDPIPSPYENTVTRQSPNAGETVDRGSEVTLWYSTGLGSDYVEVPDVVGLTVTDARQALMDRKLRSVVVDAVSGSDTVSRQSRTPGTRVRQGFEIRLFAGSSEEENGE